MFVVVIEACPSQVCTVTGSTPRASHRHAAVWRRSWIRRPGRSSRPADRPLHRRGVQPVTRPGGQQEVVRSLALCTAHHQPQHPVRDRDAPVLAGLRHLGLDPLGCGVGDEQDRHRDPDEVTDPHLAQFRPSESRPRRHEQKLRQVLVPGGDRQAEGLQLVLGKRSDLRPHATTLRARVRVTGFKAINRALTAQAKNDDRDAWNRLTDDSASPDRLSATSARVTSRSVTAPTCNAASAGGIRRRSAASEM